SGLAPVGGCRPRHGCPTPARGSSGTGASRVRARRSCPGGGPATSPGAHRRGTCGPDRTRHRVPDGIESREVVVSSLERALTILAEHDPERVLTLGGECSVSVAPFAHLAARYGDDLAVIWIDSHPDA